jgi:spoIIIJ-associated protein
MQQQLTSIIEEIVTHFSTSVGVPCRIDIREPETSAGVVEVNITTDEDARFLIGKNGQNLAALEHVIRTVCYRHVETDSRISVDVNGYRRERAQQLVETTRAAVSQVRESGRPHTMQPMNAAERRIVHTELANYTDVESASVGEEPFRRVVIKPVAL